jgi:hypothetical protein
MGRPAVDRQKICLDTVVIHRLGSTSGNDEVLLVYQTFQDAFLDIMSSATGKRFPNGPVLIIKPGKKVFRPKLESIQKIKVITVSKRKLVFAKSDKTIDSSVVVIILRVADKLVNTVHLHFDFTADRDLTPENGLPKPAVIDRRSGIREHMSSILKVSCYDWNRGEIMNPFEESICLTLNEKISDSLLNASIQWNIMTDDGKNPDDVSLYAVILANNLDGVIPYYEIYRKKEDFDIDALKEALETWIFSNF